MPSAKQTEREKSDSESEYEVTPLPDYDLPVRRQKTDLEVYQRDELNSEVKMKRPQEEPSAEWEKLKTKPQENLDIKSPFVLGSGKTSGTFFALIRCIILIIRTSE